MDDGWEVDETEVGDQLQTLLIDSETKDDAISAEKEAVIVEKDEVMPLQEESVIVPLTSESQDLNLTLETVEIKEDLNDSVEPQSENEGNSEVLMEEIPLTEVEDKIQENVQVEENKVDSEELQILRNQAKQDKLKIDQLEQLTANLKKKMENLSMEKAVLAENLSNREDELERAEKEVSFQL